jgi:hypothetical protein
MYCDGICSISSFVLLSTIRTTGTFVLLSIAMENSRPGPAAPFWFSVWTALATSRVADADATGAAVGAIGGGVLKLSGEIAIESYPRSYRLVAGGFEENRHFFAAG